MKLSDFFSNSFETTDQISDDRLKTRIYDNTYLEVRNAVISVCKQMNLTVTHVDDNFQELLINGKKYELIITCISNSYYETTVDIKITTKYLISCGRGIKHIDEFYSEINRKLRYRGLMR